MFSEKIKLLRKENGNVTQQRLADLLGITQQSVGAWERDKAMPDLASLIKLADIFDVSTDFLLDRPVPVPAPPCPLCCDARERKLVENFRLLDDRDKEDIEDNLGGKIRRAKEKEDALCGVKIVG